MQKQTLITELLSQLHSNLNSLIAAAMAAKAEATSEESKAENKYDTRGLEASYLAGAQAKRADELKTTIDKITKLDLLSFNDQDAISPTALITVTDQEGCEKLFFLLPFSGGSKLQLGSQEVTVITPQSPMGQKLLGLKCDDEFNIKVQGNTVIEYTVTNIQ